MNAVIFGSSAREAEVAVSLIDQDMSVYCVTTDVPEMGINVSEVEVVGDFANQPEESIARIESIRPDLIVVQEEKLLFQGLATEFRTRGLTVLGADQDAAVFEQDKTVLGGIISDRLPSLMPEKLPPGLFKEVDTMPDHCVVRTRNVAGSFTTIIVDSDEKKEEVARLFRNEEIIAEEFVEGTPLTFYVFTNGSNFITTPPIKTYPFRDNANQGKKTGGMGAAISTESSQSLSNTAYDRVSDIASCIVEEAGIMDNGVLQCFSIEVIANGDSVYFIESDVRLGDPETSALCSLMNHKKFGRIVLDVANQDELTTDFGGKSIDVISVVLAPKDYPDATPGTIEVENRSIEEMNQGTRLTLGKVRFDNRAGTIQHQGSRIGTLTSTGNSINGARSVGYERILRAGLSETIGYRTDIGT